eukprot:PITA_05372
MEHLLNNYIFTSSLWDYFANIFQRSNSDRGCIFNTLNRWRNNCSGNEIHGTAWALTPSFIIWNVWKERNKRIFRNEKRSLHCLLKQTLTQLKEMSLNRRVLVMVSKQEFWHPPPLGYLKYNIDGASKGNLGSAIFGGVLRDDTGNLLSFFHGHLGRATNNMAEAMAMEKCLDLLV